MDKVGLRVDELEALSESALAEELAFEVATNTNLTVLLLVLLLNDNLRR